MNKKDFNKELKLLLPIMTEAQIETAINALNSCKAAVYKKDNTEKSEMARLFSTFERCEAEFYYIGEKNKEGVIKAFGASLLTISDFGLLKEKIPASEENWWLYEQYHVLRNDICWLKDRKKGGKIRPVIIIDEIRGNLVPGEVFYINADRFQLLTPRLAIRASCFDDTCSYVADNYESSVLRFCVDGWYMKLIKENEKQKENTDAADDSQ